MAPREVITVIRAGNMVYSRAFASVFNIANYIMIPDWADVRIGVWRESGLLEGGEFSRRAKDEERKNFLR